MERPFDLCIRVQNDLALFVGGELEQHAAREIARHLEACPACRDAHARARAAQQALVRGLATGNGPDLWPALRGKLEREGLLRSPASSSAPIVPVVPMASIAPRRRFAGARGWWTAAAAAAVVLVSAWGARAWLDECLPDGSSELVVDPHGPREIGPRGNGSLAGEPISATPVADGRLHRLGAREGSLLDNATVLGAEEPMWLDLQRPRNEQPVGLRRFGSGW